MNLENHCFSLGVILQCLLQDAGVSSILEGVFNVTVYTCTPARTAFGRLATLTLKKFLKIFSISHHLAKQMQARID